MLPLTGLRSILRMREDACAAVMCRGCNPVRDSVSFEQISAVLQLTDQLGFNREWVEIPLSPESPGKVHRLQSGKVEIVVDAAAPFEVWLASLEEQLKPFAPE